MAKINTWPGWKCARQLGTGGFGKVYEIQREEFGKVYTAAMKVITIPANPAEVQEAYCEGMDEQSVTEYFRSFVETITSEFALMSEFKGHSNIVSYEDHMVVEHEQDFGWDILIRMEILTPLQQWVTKHNMEEEDIVRLGCDICRALELCQRKNIIHRDIKPENIFVNEYGDYKLGDFGIARTVEKTISNLSRKGTYTYMAPEVYLGHPYGATADIYSLGTVLYRYLNNYRAPFLPQGDICYSDREMAMAKRINGEQIPEPVNGSGELKKTIIKALAYDPAERFQTALEFRRELENCIKHENTVFMFGMPENKTGAERACKENIIQSRTEEEATAFLPGGSVSKEKSSRDPIDGVVDDANNPTELSIQTEHLKQREPLESQGSEMCPVLAKKPENMRTRILIAGIIGALIVVGIITAVYLAGKGSSLQVTDMPNSIEPEIDESDSNGSEAGNDGLIAGGTTNILLVGDTAELWLKEGSIIIFSESKDLNWISDNTSVATVDENGIVTAIAPGTVDFMGNYQGKSAVWQMQIVEDEENSGAKVIANYENISMVQGGSETLELTLSGNIPENFGASCYSSAGLDLLFEWGELSDSKLPLKITTLMTSSSREGDVTILVYPLDNPGKIVANTKVYIKINE